MPMRHGPSLAASALALLLGACSSLPPASDPVPRDGAALTAQADRLILVTLDNPVPPASVEPGSTPHGYDLSARYTVSSQAHNTANQLARRFGLTRLREWPIVPLKVACLVFELPAGTDRSEMLMRLARDPRVRLAQPLQRFSAFAGTANGYNDPYLPLQRGFETIAAGAAQQWSRGAGVTVAVIDTGVDLRHPDLAGRIAASRNFIDDDERAFETDAHGTAVAGIIAAVANNGVGIVGVSPEARLLVYKACEPVERGQLAAQCNSFTLALALSAAIEAHAQIVNLSLGGPADPLLSELVTRGEQRGIIFVGAVPLDGAVDGFPLGIPGVIAADDSEHGALPVTGLPAPGHDILSLAPGARYDFATGSSFAAAHVTGALALLHASAPNASTQTLWSALSRTRRQLDGRESIDVCAALALMQPTDRCGRMTDVAPATARARAD